MYFFIVLVSNLRILDKNAFRTLYCLNKQYCLMHNNESLLENCFGCLKQFKNKALSVQYVNKHIGCNPQQLIVVNLLVNCLLNFKPPI